MSPPGGDFTEPVTRHTKRFIRCFWGLDKNLANARHFPAISWLDSYSEYAKEVEEWFEGNVEPRWGELREKSRAILLEDEKIQQVIRLVGEDVLPDDQRLLAYAAFLVKNGYLQQAAFGSDSYSPPSKGFAILDLIMYFYDRGMELVRQGVPISLIRQSDAVENLVHLREIPSEDKSSFDDARAKLDAHLNRVETERTREQGGA